MKTKRLVTAAAVAALFAMPASAGEFHGTAAAWFTFTPVALEVEGGDYYTTGMSYGMNALDSEDPTLANVVMQCLGWAAPDGSNSGRCVNVDPEGDKWFEWYTCDASGIITPPPGTLFAMTCGTTITGGTGKFANIAGSGTFTQITVGVLADGTQIGLTPTHYDLSW